MVRVFGYTRRDKTSGGGLSRGKAPDTTQSLRH
ncbi:uncharacterized protein G2W53_002137 [Senna tora]|uniref:Uncharacterized protein n=1 Tax=Senna tora TaxID=362788 RepID=A0A834XHK5_9FABA|nr:uncharacterized protein G2W53_002137 [Senna tora]